MSQPLHLDGTTLEGGGQLLRLALALSSLTKQSLTITNIRGKRSGGGGLKAQHLTSLQWLSAASHAHTRGVFLKSRDITFTPSPLPHPPIWTAKNNQIHIIQSTPGAISLVLQAILPYILFSPSSPSSPAPIHIHIAGGTNVTNAPSTEYIAAVLIPTLSLIGIPRITPRLHSRGWSLGPARVGAASYTVTPLASGLPAFRLEDRGAIVNVKVHVLAPVSSHALFRTALARVFAVRGDTFFDAGTQRVTEVCVEDSAHEKRFYLLMVATAASGVKLGRDWLFDRVVRPRMEERVVEAMVEKVAGDLIAEIAHGGCVDEWMRDQLVVFQALARGKSYVDGGRGEGKSIRPSLHAKTAGWVVERMLGVEWNGEGECEGIGCGGQADREDDVSEDLAEEVQKLDISH